MAWQQLELRLTQTLLPQAEALLGLLGARSVTLAPDGGEEILEPDPGTMPLSPLVRVQALFAGDIDLGRAGRMLEEALACDLGIVARPLADADWSAALAVDARELEIGTRLVIAAAGAATRCGQRTIVRLGRGLGFGTGEHPTTRLCLEWLDARLAHGATVLDYGCGSGVLALAALRLGAARAWAVDVEPQALEATSANAALNAVADRLWVGPPDRLPKISVDVIVANILARPLIELAPRFAALGAPSATVVLTGILAAQQPSVRRAYETYFAPIEVRERDGWTLLVTRAPMR